MSNDIFSVEFLYAIHEITVTLLGSIGNMCLYRQLPAPLAPPPCPLPSTLTISPAHGNRGTQNPKWGNWSITSTFLQTREDCLGLEVQMWHFTISFHWSSQYMLLMQQKLFQLSPQNDISRGRSQTEEPYPVFRSCLFPPPEAAAGLPPAANPPESAAATTTATTTTASSCTQVYFVFSLLLIVLGNSKKLCNKIF